MTLPEDALISAKAGVVAILLGELEWRELMMDPASAPWRTTLNSGQVAYCGITTWVAFYSRVAVLDKADAEAEGLTL